MSLLLLFGGVGTFPVISDAAMPMASVLPLVGDTVLPLSSKRLLASDANLLVADYMSLLADFDISLSVALNLISSETFPIFAEGMLLTFGDAAMPLAISLTNFSNITAPIFTFADVLPSDASIPAASVSRLITDVVVPILASLGLSANTPVRLAAELVVSSDQILPLGTFIYTDFSEGYFPAGSFLITPIDIDTRLAGELQAMGDVSSPVVLRLVIASDEPLPLAAAGIIGGLISDTILPISVFLTISSDKVLPIISATTGDLINVQFILDGFFSGTEQT